METIAVNINGVKIDSVVFNERVAKYPAPAFSIFSLSLDSYSSRCSLDSLLQSNLPWSLNLIDLSYYFHLFALCTTSYEQCLYRRKPRPCAKIQLSFYRAKEKQQTKDGVRIIAEFSSEYQVVVFGEIKEMLVGVDGRALVPVDTLPTGVATILGRNFDYGAAPSNYGFQTWNDGLRFFDRFRR